VKVAVSMKASFGFAEEAVPLVCWSAAMAHIELMDAQ
jgi:hypothetical protein